ncbi:MAG: kinase domain-containing protein [Siphoviridae sp. ctdc_1]|nr:MAG: kinase domain-containing protein [Siphoviridae sp. ctdc_1]
MYSDPVVSPPKFVILVIPRPLSDVIFGHSEVFNSPLNGFFLTLNFFRVHYCAVHQHVIPSRAAIIQRYSFHFVSFHFVSFHFVSFHFVSFHFVTAFTSSAFTSSAFTSSAFTSSAFTSSGRPTCVSLRANHIR